MFTEPPSTSPLLATLSLGRHNVEPMHSDRFVHSLGCVRKRAASISLHRWSAVQSVGAYTQKESLLSSHTTFTRMLRGFGTGMRSACRDANPQPNAVTVEHANDKQAAHQGHTPGDASANLNDMGTSSVLKLPVAPNSSSGVRLRAEVDMPPKDSGV